MQLSRHVAAPGVVVIEGADHPAVGQSGPALVEPDHVRFGFHDSSSSSSCCSPRRSGVMLLPGDGLTNSRTTTPRASPSWPDFAGFGSLFQNTRRARMGL